MTKNTNTSSYLSCLLLLSSSFISHPQTTKTLVSEFSNHFKGERKPTSLTSVRRSVFVPDGTTQTDVHTENTDVSEVVFHPLQWLNTLQSFLLSDKVCTISRSTRVFSALFCSAGVNDEKSLKTSTPDVRERLWRFRRRLTTRRQLRCRRSTSPWISTSWKFEKKLYQMFLLMSAQAGFKPSNLKSLVVCSTDEMERKQL
jgi:hypothetical protein